MPFGDCWYVERWAYRCHREVVDRVRDFLARTSYLRKKIITWLVTGIDLQTLYVDVPWLVTGIEFLNSSDVPWLDTGIESAIMVNRYALAGYRNRIWKCCS